MFVESALPDELSMIPVILILAYYPVLDGFIKFTLGKYIVRIKVVDFYGQPSGFLRAAQRTLRRIVEVNPVCAGGLQEGSLFS